MTISHPLLLRYDSFWFCSIHLVRNVINGYVLKCRQWRINCKIIPAFFLAFTTGRRTFFLLFLSIMQITMMMMMINKNNSKQHNTVEKKKNMCTQHKRKIIKNKPKYETHTHTHIHLTRKRRFFYIYFLVLLIQC